MKERISATVAVLAAISCVLAVAGCGDSGEPATGPASRAATPTQQPTLTVQDLMLAWVVPASDIIWGAGEPTTDEQWRTVATSAQGLVDASGMLLLPRPVVGAGQTVPGGDAPGALTGEEIGRRIGEMPEEWGAKVAVMQGAGREIATAAQGKDLDRLLTAQDALLGSCEACHQRFWYGQ